LDIFGEKVHGTVPQKNACLHLYGSYVPKGSEECTWKKESDMPPASREEFCSAWGRLDKLCRECARPRPAARRDFTAAMRVPWLVSATHAQNATRSSKGCTLIAGIAKQEPHHQSEHCRRPRQALPLSRLSSVGRKVWP
jgi:hypothetical protein